MLFAYQAFRVRDTNTGPLCMQLPVKESSLAQQQLNHFSVALFGS